MAAPGASPAGVLVEASRAEHLRICECCAQMRHDHELIHARARDMLDDDGARRFRMAEYARRRPTRDERR